MRDNSGIFTHAEDTGVSVIFSLFLPAAKALGYRTLFLLYGPYLNEL